MGNDFTTSLLNGFGGGPAYADNAASGDPSGYKGNSVASANAIVVGLVIVFVAILLVLGVVMLRVSGEIVI